MKNIPIILLLIVLVMGCKKKEEPAPGVAPGKLIIWSSHNVANTEGVFAQVTQGSKMWTGIISLKFNTAPLCNTSDCFTLELEPGTYNIQAVSANGTVVWNQSSMTIAKNSGCNSYELK